MPTEHKTNKQTKRSKAQLKQNNLRKIKNNLRVKYKRVKDVY